MSSKTPISSEADFEQRTDQIAAAYGTGLGEAFNACPDGGGFQSDWFAAGKSLGARLIYMANCDPDFVVAFIDGMRVAVAAGQSEPYWVKDGPWEQRYDEMVTAVYGAALATLQKWQVDIGPGIEGLIDEGLGDDVWDWLVGRVPALVRDIRAPQGDEAKAERIAERIAQAMA